MKIYPISTLRIHVKTIFSPQRGKKIPEGLASVDEIQSYKQISSHLVSFAREKLCMLVLLHCNQHYFNILPFFQGLHSASNPGILALDLHAADTSRVLTGTTTSAVYMSPVNRASSGHEILFSAAKEDLN